jgi:ubiquinone/menaquinone biosynthesis C-methylase UbiE/glycosyltransferase involved in cell wall biosynthesis
MRLHWFSPLPPARSGIADYTVRVIPALSALAEMVLWTDQEEWDSAIEDYAEVRHYQLKEIPWAEINRGTMSVYHLGNNHRIHGQIWQVSKRHSGMVILHDTALHQFFAGLFREQWRDRAGYLELMEHYYGPRGRQDAEDFWAGRLTIDYMAQHYRLSCLAVESALAALVHTPGRLDQLERESPCPLAYAPLPYPASTPPPPTHAHSTRSRAKGPPYRLIVFGHISDNRRLASLLRALVGFPERHLFRLDVYGELWDPTHVSGMIECLALQGLVTLHGFVPMEELHAALAEAHLAFNLRFPTMGEASISQLQIWDHALPSVVTKVGWYASLPEGTVAFVRPEHEITDIQAQLSAFLADPGAFAKIGEWGRLTLETHHAPEAYAQAIVNLVSEAQAFRPRAIAYDLTRRVGQETRLWTNLPEQDKASPLWGQLVGFGQAQNSGRKPIEAINYQHVEALKSIRDMLSAQMKRLERQLSMSLQSIRQAASEEFYVSHQQPGGEVPSPPSAQGLAAQNLPSDRADQTIEAAISAPAEELHPFVSASTGGPQPNASQTTVAKQAGAEWGPRKAYTRDDALRYPLSVEGHDTGFRYFFNFMVVAKSLGLRPGDEVLDFGAGSCFVSELLNRFGYITVAFDIDAEILAIGQERLALDPRSDRRRSRFVAGDGMRLPFRDESFDGIICMNALHHMPDYRATLAEMCRVLRAGGRAAFAEPGDQHSKSPESILAMEQYGALEKDVVLSEIYQLAREVGFRRMILKPYVLPEMVELDYEEFEGFKRGEKVSGPFLTAGEIADFVKGQPLFCLEKLGTRPLTSARAPAATLRARIVIRECPTQVPRQGRFKVVAVCENVGQCLWLAQAREFGGYVTFGVKLLTPDGRLLEDSRGRQPLARDVSPGSRIDVLAEVSVEGLKPGRYRLLFDMVNELVCWFQVGGSEVVERWIEVL